MSEWVNIDKLGMRGMEPDMIPTDRDPQSMDVIVNMRSQGTNLANAGGFAAVPFGDIPDEVTPSNCSPCPAIFFDTSIEDGEIQFDRSWTWDDNARLHFLAVFEINRANQDYDQILRIRSGECNKERQDRCDIEILNTSGNRRVKVLRYDTNGTLTSTLLDYDADPIFSDGSQHWIIVEQYDPGASALGLNIWIDDSQIYADTHLQQYVSRFTSVLRANSPFGIALPIAFYHYSQTLRDCLTSGNFNGFGRCLSIRNDNPFIYDRSLTDVDIDLYTDQRIATPKLGTASRRTAYLDHGTASGKIYMEWVRDHASCRIDGYFVGGVKRGLSLGTNIPGVVPDSWAYTGPSGRLYIDGNPFIEIGILPSMLRILIALDIEQGLLYLGGGEDVTTPEWLGGGTPEAGATSWDVGTSAADMQMVTTFFESDEAITYLSSADSCRHAPPTGFGYLRAP